ncbi:MAG: acetate--CoA ligase family protein [Promethearchaeota archaeon]
MVETNSTPHFLQKFVNPRTIAVVGANESIPNNMGAFQLLTLLDNGYKGKIYPIHPKLDTVFGIKAYKTALDVPDVIDLAEIILPKKYVPQVLEELGQNGCKNVILVTAGFKEQGNLEGRDEILQILKKYGMRLIGPNCIGILNTHTHYSDQDSSTCIMNTTVQSYNESPGNVSIISQSGTFVSHIFMLLEERDLHLSKTFSVGNEANIDLCDCLAYLGDDPETDVILMYIEEIKRGTEFLRLVKEILPRKPILCLYVGGSEGGAKAASSHTGSIGGNDEIFNGMVAQTGLIRVMNLENLLDAAMVFSKFLPNNIIPKGNRVAVVTNSGGPGATMADQTTRLGLRLPNFSDKLKNKIGRFLPSTGQISNPLDYTFALNPVFFYESVPKLIAKSGEIDSMLVYGALGAAFFRYNGEGKEILKMEINRNKMEDWLALSRGSIGSGHKLMLKYSFPIINVNFLGTKEPMFTFLNKSGFPTFRMPHQAVNALKTYTDYCTRFYKKPSGSSKVPKG